MRTNIVDCFLAPSDTVDVMPVSVHLNTRWHVLNKPCRRRAHGQTQKPSGPNGIVLVVTERTQLVWWACRRRGG